MKKLILSIAFLVGIISLSNAQTKVGIKLGGGLSSLTTSDEVPGSEVDPKDFFSSKMGYQAGAFARLEISDKFLFQPELLWKTKASTIDQAVINGSTSDMDFKTSYLSVPVLAGYQPVENLSILVGPEVGMALSADIEAEGVTLDVKDNLESNLDLGINLGVEYQLDFGLGIGLRYNYGLNKPVSVPSIFDSSVQSEINVDYRSGEVMFYVTYSFLK